MSRRKKIAKKSGAVSLTHKTDRQTDQHGPRAGGWRRGGGEHRP